MLDWLESRQLRQRCHAGLNKSEQRHALAQEICTFKQGRIAERGHEAQQFRASGLNLVIAAIVYWNSTYIADAVAHLRAEGQAVPDALLAHTSPLTWEHIGFSGDFLWDRAAATAGRRRPLNLGRAPDGRMTRVPDPFTLSVVYVTTDAMPSTSPSKARGVNRASRPGVDFVAHRVPAKRHGAANPDRQPSHPQKPWTLSRSRGLLSRRAKPDAMQNQRVARLSRELLSRKQ